MCKWPEAALGSSTPAWLPCPAPPGRRAGLLTICARFQAKHQSRCLCWGWGSPRENRGRASPSFQIFLNEKHRRKTDTKRPLARTPAWRGHGRAQPGARGRGEHLSLPLARPELARGQAAEARRPGDAAGSPPAPLRSPSAKPLSRRMCRSLRGPALPSSRPGHPASLLLSFA